MHRFQELGVLLLLKFGVNELVSLSVAKVAVHLEDHFQSGEGSLSADLEFVSVVFKIQLGISETVLGTQPNHVIYQSLVEFQRLFDNSWKLGRGDVVVCSSHVHAHVLQDGPHHVFRTDQCLVTSFVKFFLEREKLFVVLDSVERVALFRLEVEIPGALIALTILDDFHGLAQRIRNCLMHFSDIHRGR